jgi:hypothetical protein
MDILSALPPHLRARVLAFADEKSQQAALSVPESEKLPAVPLPLLNSDALHILNREILTQVEEQGFAVWDDFLPSDLCERAHAEVEAVQFWCCR